MVSVIIPMYNAESTIKITIESVLNQTYLGFIEIVVVNDGSKDSSLKIIEEMQSFNYSNRVIKVLNKKNGGVASARNMGLREATQAWIALLDADDEWIPEKLNMQFEAIRDNSEILFLGTNFNDLRYPFFGKNKFTIYTLSQKEILFKWWPATPTVLFSRKLLDEFNMSYDEKLSHGEDGRFLLQASNYCSIFTLNKNTVWAGRGKRTYGEAGLSSNLPQMFKGELRNLAYSFNSKQINIFYYAFFYIFLTLKYVRRKAVVSFKI